VRATIVSTLSPSTASPRYAKRTDTEPRRV